MAKSYIEIGPLKKQTISILNGNQSEVIAWNNSVQNGSVGQIHNLEEDENKWLIPDGFISECTSFMTTLYLYIGTVLVRWLYFSFSPADRTLRNRK